ncbi:MAG: hypothetical protein H0W45_01445 [Acidobacteria bacterium]|nr:hypothetical protein [Acidobacteriota bacterium]
MSNKSLDVRAKQRLCTRVVWFLSACVLQVFAHVISTESKQFETKVFVAKQFQAH